MTSGSGGSEGDESECALKAAVQLNWTPQMTKQFQDLLKLQGQVPFVPIRSPRLGLSFPHKRGSGEMVPPLLRLNRSRDRTLPTITLGPLARGMTSHSRLNHPPYPIASQFLSMPQQKTSSLKTYFDEIAETNGDDECRAWLDKGFRLKG